MKNQQKHKLKGLDNIVIYDGECLLCSTSIRRILSYEKSAELKFATLNSSFIKKLKLKSDPGDSILFYSDGRVSTRSTAVFKIAGYLRSPWSWFRYFGVLPTLLTDFGYRIIARYRYRWFGKVDDVCILSDSLGERYLG